MVSKVAYHNGYERKNIKDIVIIHKFEKMYIILSYLPLSCDERHRDLKKKGVIAKGV